MPFRSEWNFPEYRHLANELRARIGDGVYMSGESLPSSRWMAVEFRVSRDTAREALRVLANEGLVMQHERQPTTVMELPVRKPLLIPFSASIIARMPTPKEAGILDINPNVGVPVLVVCVPGRPDEVYSANATVLCADAAFALKTGDAVRHL